MQHERATYKEILPENSINIALTFPELTSNEMVQQQITIYMQNREKITKRKKDKTPKNVYEQKTLDFLRETIYHSQSEIATP